MPSIGNLYADVVPNFKTLGSNIAAQSPLLKKMGSSIGGKMMLGVGAGIAVAGAVVAKQAISAALDFEKGLATIRTGTGATGRQLEELGEGARRVFRQVPQDFQEVSGTLADLNTRTGATGKQLEGLTRTMLDLSRITGEDVNTLIPATTRLFGDWSIKTKDQTETLDQLFKLSQSTGIGVADLSQKMVQFGSPLRQLGIDFDFSAAMFARFEKEGVNVQTLMPGLRMSLKNFAKPTDDLAKTFDKLGINAAKPEKALMQVFEAIKTATPKEATNLAFDVFGARAGPDMAAAIQEGRFSLEELMGAVDDSGESIKEAGEDSLTLGEKWEILKNKINDILVPLGQKLIPKVEQLVEWFGKAIEPSGSLGKLFGFIGDNAKTLATVLGGALAFAIGVKLINAFNAMKLAMMTNPFTAIAIAALTVATLIITNWDKIKEVTLNVFNAVKDFLSSTWKTIKNTTADIVGGMLSFLTRGFRNFVKFFFDVAQGILDGAAKAFGWVPGVGDRIEKFRDGFKRATDGIIRDLDRQIGKFNSWGDKSRGNIQGVNSEIGKLITNLKGISAPGTIRAEFAGGAGGGLGPGMGLVAVGQRLQAGGYRVGEHPAFGGVGGHSPGSYHYMGRAIDVNWGPGGESLAEKIKLNALGGALRQSLGNRIRELFFPAYDPVGGHQDHLHLAMDRGGIVKGPALISQGPITEAHIPLSGPHAAKATTKEVHYHISLPNALLKEEITEDRLMRLFRRMETLSRGAV